jgi:hypothetical protein
MSDETRLQRNWRRRAIGLVLCLSPIAILIASLIVGIKRGTALTPGLYYVLPGALIAALNFHLSWTRPLLYRLAHGSMEGYRFVSGVPIVGVFFVLAGVLPWFGDVITALAGLAVLFADTGSPPWFLAMTWRDSWLWDVSRLP